MVKRRAGERRHFVQLQAITGRTPSGDGYVNTWTPYARIWASVTPAAASQVERGVAGTAQVPTTHLVDLDYRTDIRTSHRVWFDGRALFITGIQNVDERKVTTVLSCEERNP